LTKRPFADTIPRFKTLDKQERESSGQLSASLEEGVPLSLLAVDDAVRLDQETGARPRGYDTPRPNGSSVFSLKHSLGLHDKEQLTLSGGISNLRHKEKTHPTHGTIGFYAMVNGPRRGELVLVSSHHVLLAAGGLRGDPIYRCSGKQGNSAATRDLDPIAHVSDEGSEQNYSFAYPGEDAADYFIDCASARVPHPNPLLASANFVRRPARIHSLDVAGRRFCRVRKVGNATALTEGRVVDAAATVRSGGISRARNLVIRGIGGRFAEPGDSGALIVNDRDEAVGLLWGCDDNDVDIVYGCHIHPVLDRLGVAMLTRGMQ
jgi:hypothetical protein